MENKFIETVKMIKFKIINKNFFSNKNKLILHKNGKYDNITVILSPHLVKAKQVKDIEFLCNKVEYFLKVLEQNCRGFNPKIFEKNFKNILFNLSELQDKKSTKYNGFVRWKHSGHWTVDEFMLKSYKPVFHELLHMALSKGPCHRKYEFYNEGYTQLLEHRYFNFSGNSYAFEEAVLSNIELLIGKDYMEKQAFAGNLINTIDGLLAYTSQKNVELLVYNMNIVYTIENHKNILNHKDEMQQALDIVFNILFNCLKEKMNEMSSLSDKMELFYSFNVGSIDYKFLKSNQVLSFKLGDRKKYICELKDTILKNSKDQKNKQ